MAPPLGPVNSYRQVPASHTSIAADVSDALWWFDWVAEDGVKVGFSGLFKTKSEIVLGSSRLCATTLGASGNNLSLRATPPLAHVTLSS